MCHRSCSGPPDQVTVLRAIGRGDFPLQIAGTRRDEEVNPLDDGGEQNVSKAQSRPGTGPSRDCRFLAILRPDDLEELTLVADPPVKGEGVRAPEPCPDGERAIALLAGEHVDGHPGRLRCRGVPDYLEPTNHRWRAPAWLRPILGSIRIVVPVGFHSHRMSGARKLLPGPGNSSPPHVQ